MFYVSELLDVSFDSVGELESFDDELSAFLVGGLELVLPAGRKRPVGRGVEVEGQGRDVVDLPAGLEELQQTLLEHP